ncbi:hypothetical protein VPH35_059682 [Triticum aestivum]
MASPPLPPGFASRGMESPWLPPRVTSVAAARQLHRCHQESHPDKVTSSESPLSLVLLPCLMCVCVCVCVCVCLPIRLPSDLQISIFGECGVLVSLDYYLYSGISYGLMYLVRVWMLGNSDL